MLGLFPKNFPWATFGSRETDDQVQSQWKSQKDRVFLFQEEPLVSLVVTGVDVASLEELRLTLEGIRRQSYPSWEAWVVGFSAQAEAVVKSLGDPRFRWQSVGAKGPALQKNEVLKAVSGDWVGFVTAGDILSPTALYHFILELGANTNAQLLYCNEAWVDSELKTIEGFYSKRDYSWFNLIHFNCIGKFWLIKRQWIDELGTFDPSCGVDHEHEFLLRLSDLTDVWHHIPYFLIYRRREDERELGTEFVERLKIHLAAKSLSAEIAVVDRAGRQHLKVIPKIENPETKLISVVIGFRNKAYWTLRCLDSLVQKVGKIPIELVLINNESDPGELARIERRLEVISHPFKIISYEGPFNYGHMNNLAVREHCRGDLILLLNNDVFLETPGTLDELAAWASLNWVGGVGILLKYPHGDVQYDGFRATFGGLDHLAKLGHFAVGDRFSRENREVFANTFAACMVRRSVYDTVGGLRELDLANGFGDVAFSFECLRRGLHNVFLGHLEATHLESASRGRAYEYWEETVVERQYPDILQKMLRSDLGWNRVPEGKLSLGKDVQHVIWSHFRDRTAWLDPIKPTAKKLLRDLKMWKDEQPSV